MHAQIDQRAAAGARLIAEPAAWAALAAQVGRLGIIDIAQAIVIDQILHDGAVVAETADEADHQQAVVALSRFEHPLRFGGVHGHGLFTQNVLARVQRGDGAFGVRRVPGADGNGVDLRQFGEHLVLVGVQAGDMILFRAAMKVLFVDVAKGVNFNVGVLRIRVEMAAGKAAAADNRNLQFLIHGTLSFIQ